MLSIDPAVNTERENYKLLIGTIIPRPIAFVTTVSKGKVLNGAPFSYFNIVSSNPPMISISIQRREGTMKDTARNIQETKEFVIHIVDEHNVVQINKTAVNLAPDESEIELAGFTPAESETISVPGIKEAKVRMECLLERSIPLGDSNTPGCDLIVGRVVRFHIDPQIYEEGRIDPRGLGAVSRLAGANYAKIGEIFSIERPQ